MADEKIVVNYNVYWLETGAHGGVVVKARHYKPVGRGFRFPMVSLEFSVT